MPLPDTYQRPPVAPHESFAGPYHRLLDLLRVRGDLAHLRASDDGMLRVAIPFCGSLREHAALCDFLAAQCLTRPNIRAAVVDASDLSDSHATEWAMAERWCEATHPRIALRTRGRTCRRKPSRPPTS